MVIQSPSQLWIRIENMTCTADDFMLCSGADIQYNHFQFCPNFRTCPIQFTFETHIGVNVETGAIVQRHNPIRRWTYFNFLFLAAFPASKAETKSRFRLQFSSRSCGKPVVNKFNHIAKQCWLVGLKSQNKNVQEWNHIFWFVASERRCVNIPAWICFQIRYHYQLPVWSIMVMVKVKKKWSIPGERTAWHDSVRQCWQQSWRDNAESTLNEVKSVTFTRPFIKAEVFVWLNDNRKFSSTKLYVTTSAL